MNQIKAAEGLFESLPQGMLQSYILLQSYYCGIDKCTGVDTDDLQNHKLPEETSATLPILSLFASFLSTTMSIAMLPQDVFIK
eukprot:SAG11_NODE_29_length_23137_cov_16.739995_4_plen_83_part_00